MTDEPTVALMAWNPRRPVVGGRMGRLLPVRARVNNFGDLIGPYIVRTLLRRAGIDHRRPVRSARLLTAGSIMHFARPGDVIWGSGINGKKLDAGYAPGGLDIRAVRGPLTRQFLQDKGHPTPAVYGDPAILTGTLWPAEELRDPRMRRPYVVVPNLHDARMVRAEHLNVIDPRYPLLTCLRAIANADRVIASSLHGVVVAESFGVPATLVASSVEPTFKYADYYEGTGRPAPMARDSVDEALRSAPEPPPKLDVGPLLDAFPYDLWTAEGRAARARSAR
jgi:pyruvyltransferase